MSTHTMPPMSLMCEDFVKSMVKPVGSTANNSSDTCDGTDDALATRLNGDSAMNGFATHSDDDDDNDDGDGDGDIKMTNGSMSSPAINTKNLRKDLIRKTDELKRNHKSNGIREGFQLAVNEDEETTLKFIAKQVIHLQL